MLQLHIRIKQAEWVHCADIHGVSLKMSMLMMLLFAKRIIFTSSLSFALSLSRAHSLSTSVCGLEVLVYAASSY